MTTTRRLATRRQLLVAALAALAIPAYAIDYREISWDDLVPKDWDPMKSFRDLQNLDALPDTDPRMQKLYDRMRQVWDSAPTVPAMQGTEGRIAGYLVPLEEGKQGIREFLLVPYFGACIHLPPPPANQIVHVRASTPVRGLRSMDAVWVSGRFGLQRSDSTLGVSGYTMAADSVTKHQGPGGKP